MNLFAIIRRGWGGGAGLLLLPVACTITTVHAASDTEVSAELGRRIYEEGILPNGSPLQALRAEGILLEGKSAACMSCHRRSGMGTLEGSLTATVLVPPVAGPLLFSPARFHGSFLDPAHHWVPNPAWARAMTRGAYDEASLGRALRDRLDVDGRRLHEPMPHYALDDRAVSSLASHLKRLAAASPGVEHDTLHLATVITPDVTDGQAEAVLGVLRAWAGRARGVDKAWQLHVWRLTGPAEGWREQLEADYRRQPVFAVLSGVGAAQWSPVARFCEENRVPCVLPSVEVVPESKGSYYSLYYSPGVALEARVLAGYLNANPSGHRVVQVTADASGRQAAMALHQQLKAGEPPIEQPYSGTLPAALPQDGDLVLWLRPKEIQQLVSAMPQGPAVKRVFLSALLAPPEEVTLPPSWKVRVSWVSLFDDLGVQAQIAKARLQRWLQQQGIPHNGMLRLQADAYAACSLFTTALSAIGGEEIRRPHVPLNREHLLETLENVVTKYSDGTNWVDPDSHVAFYGRMSLGPGQRVAVHGGSVVRYASPESRKLVLASERIVR